MPQVLATGQAHPGDLTVDDAYVYWVTWDSPATLARVPKEGGPVETLATDLASPWALVLAGDHLYFGDDDDTVKRVPKAGGCVEIIAQGLDTPEYLAVDATHVYFTYPGLGEVLKVPRAGGTPTKLATLQAQPEEIVVDDGFVYWVNVDNNSNQGAIRRLPKDATPSDAPTDLATGLIVPRTLKWFGAELVFLTTDGVFDTPAFKLDPALAAAPVFLFDTHGASDLELDVTVNGARFWGAEPKEHAIAYYTVATGVRVEVAKPQPMTQFIASDATHVYWSNNASGEIVRILKP